MALLFLLVPGCFLPDDYNPCGDTCIEVRPVDGGLRDAPSDSGPTLASALGPTTTAEPPPPALGGGTLLALRSGLAVLGDPDGDTIRVLDVTLPAQVGELALSPHDEPGRLVEDGTGRVHVVLRGAGAVATIDVSDPSAPTITARRTVCPVPRGIAYDRALDVLYVACAGGELVTAPPEGAVIRTAHLVDDLRDVVVDRAQLLVTRFRSAQVLVVDPIAGTVTRTVDLGPVTSGAHRLAPEVAWRAVTSPLGGAVVLHQLARADAVPQAASGFGGAACDQAIVQARLTPVTTTTLSTGVTLPCAVLAVDAAISDDATLLTVAVAGAAPIDPCGQLATFSLRSDGRLTLAPTACTALAGRVVAVAYAPDGTLLAQTRAPLGLVVSSGGVSRDVQLPGRVVADTGFDVFHASTSAHLACASCHPEGGDDGRVWVFDDDDARRTMSLRGGVLATAPFDWHGEMPTFDGVIDDVLVRQMRGGAASTAQREATARWIDARPALATRAIADADAVTRGASLFAPCGGCHAGERLSNEATLDVGTGGAFQVPSLRGVGYRAPYFHDGCAASLTEALGTCGGGVHEASVAEREDLVAYLSTL